MRSLRVRLGGSSAAAPSLGRPYPNPSRGALVIPLALPVGSHVHVAVMDPLGRTIRVLHDGVLDAGDHSLGWDARADGGSEVAAGVYRATVLR